MDHSESHNPEPADDARNEPTVELVRKPYHRPVFSELGPIPHYTQGGADIGPEGFSGVFAS